MNTDRFNELYCRDCGEPIPLEQVYCFTCMPKHVPNLTTNTERGDENATGSAGQEAHDSVAITAGEKLKEHPAQNSGLVSDPSKCPQCGELVVFPRDETPYCEECGWPDENRAEVQSPQPSEPEKWKIVYSGHIFDSWSCTIKTDNGYTIEIEENTRTEAEQLATRIVEAVNFCVGVDLGFDSQIGHTLKDQNKRRKEIDDDNLQKDAELSVLKAENSIQRSVTTDVVEDRDALKEENERLANRVRELEKAIQYASDVFDSYENMHRAKGPEAEHKALMNKRHADLLKSTLQKGDATK